ncbi:MAG: short-chain dehydrogenase/reductase [Nocardioides sp.]|jgi:NAD(P)-dependent dehydrogenase (short-subunit alcohol dehydrogenase family)|nr:short-chain dehydrogenase/reductase [Nocardioides sp.]
MTASTTTGPTTGQRVVVITGAASGVGHATAEMFRDAGDLVFGLDLHPTVPDGVTYVECNVGDRAPAEIAAAIRYLSSSDARMVTGTILAVDGCMS